MATLATYFRETQGSARSDARGIGSTAHASAVEDAFVLRPLPNDAIYFYSKRIDNSRVVRMADPNARGECWSAVGAAGVLLMLGASIIAPHVGSVLAGYKLEALKQERQSLLDQKRELEVKEAGLLSPGRLNDVARLHSLGSPAADQIVHLDAPPADGNVARNHAPAAAPVTAQQAQQSAR